jgi:lysyl-tRNA synthetase class 2
MLSTVELKSRAYFFQKVRCFFQNSGYIEVDTPLRLPVLLPETEIIPFASESWWLQTSPEQCMKRLLAQGNERLFQICHCFRKEEIGRLHEPEFTMLEWYHPGWDYHEIMDECEKLIKDIVLKCGHYDGVTLTGELERDGRTVPLASPWNRLTVEEVFLKYTGLLPADAVAANSFDELLVEKIEPHLGWDGPVFLYDYPVELGSLARRKKEKPHLAERFELYICGLELANGFSELIDPQEQRQRFVEEIERQENEHIEVILPEKFLYDLEELEDTAGIALGLDRLLMLLMGKSGIADVVAFSQVDL